jgi:signal transduction histidine kinase
MAESDKFSLYEHAGKTDTSLVFIEKKINEQLRDLRLFFIIGLFLLIGCFSLANFLIVRQIVAPNNYRIELEIAKKDMERVVEALNREIKFLSTFTLDWAAWDDTHEFVTSVSPEYIQSNLGDTSFTGNNLNLIAYYDTDGRVVWQKIIDLETMQDIKLPEFPAHGLPVDNPLLVHQDAFSKVVGIMILERGVMLVSSRPIVNSDQEGPIAGTLVFGRFFSKEHEDQLMEQTKVNLHIHLLTELQPSHYDKILASELVDSGVGSYIFKEQEGKFLVYCLFPDYRGRPVIVLEANVDRFISPQTSQLFRYVLISNILTAIAALIVILLFHNQLINSLLKIFQLSRVMAQSAIQSDNETSLSKERVSRLGRDVCQASNILDGKRLLPLNPRAKKLSADLWDVTIWLAREVEHRGKAETSLRNIANRLEQLVKDRTIELQDVNDLLHKEIDERRQYETKLEKYQKRLRAVASEMLAVEERQRRQIAVDLHDQIGQSLSFCRMSLDSMLELDSIEDVREQVSRLSEILQQTLQDTRTLTFELCPPVLHELGIGAALEWLAEMMEERYGLLVDVEYESYTPYTGSPILTLAFRSIRELLINVVRHAQTNSAQVTIRQVDEQLQLQVSDRGAGFDTKHLDLEDERFDGFGLFSIQERVKNIGGSIKIDSVVGNGTTITLIIPLGSPEENFQKEEQCRSE